MSIAEWWSLIVSKVVSWISDLDNSLLSKIVNLLTIFVIILGLIDWGIKKVRKKKKLKALKRQKAVDFIKGTAKPFKTVKILDDPTASGRQVGDILDKVSQIKGKDMKKFFKLVWYNKEQILGILGSLLGLAITQWLIWTDMIKTAFPNINGTVALVLNIIVGVLSLILAVFTNRDIFVKYGWSNLDTIDKELKVREQKAASKLTSEQREKYNNIIDTLTNKKNQLLANLSIVSKALNEITTLYEADTSLVNDYENQVTTYKAQIDEYENKIKNIEKKINENKEILKNNS